MLRLFACSAPILHTMAPIVFAIQLVDSDFGSIRRQSIIETDEQAENRAEIGRGERAALPELLADIRRARVPNQHGELNFNAINAASLHRHIMSQQSKIKR